MTALFIGPLPMVELPAQPKYEGWCTNWEAYDVPRIHDVMRVENDTLGWEQIAGFRQLSDLLVEHYRRLLSQHTQLFAAWQSPAAHEVLSRVDGFAKALLSDAHCAATTATALQGIMTSFLRAKAQVARLNREWSSVTNDWKPEWWDQAAAKLNSEARAVMVQNDAEISDHRSKIIIPDGYRISASDSETLAAGEADSATDRMVPAVPGYHPVVSASGQSASRGGASLAGMPVYQPAVPGQPVSMLPIAPGNAYAPYGGAYILPGPGVGRGGYIVPMPHPSYGPGGRGATYYPGRISTGAIAGGSGYLPVGLGTPSAQPGQGGYVEPRRKPNTTWETDKGVPTVIEGIHEDHFVPDRPSLRQEADFHDWFAGLAYPWRSEGDSSGVQVTFRRKES